MTEHPVRASGGFAPEKEVYRSAEREGEGGVPRESEMYTSANVWELDGREMAGVSELESPVVREGRDGREISGFDFGLENEQGMRMGQKKDGRYGRDRREELHF